jgi:hypothetical protein
MRRFSVLIVIAAAVFAGATESAAGNNGELSASCAAALRQADANDQLASRIFSDVQRYSQNVSTHARAADPSEAGQSAALNQITGDFLAFSASILPKFLKVPSGRSKFRAAEAKCRAGK